MPSPASTIDAVVSDPRLQPAAKAALLQRVCVIAQAVRPDVVERYWDELKAVSNHLRGSGRESFEGLKATLDPPPPKELEGFAGEIADAVAAATRSGSRDETLAGLRECEQRIKSRRWPTGKGAAWEVLVRAWIEADRSEGLRRLHHVRRPMQANLIMRENDALPLDSEQWRALREAVPAAARSAVEELLQRDEPRLNLPAELADEVSIALVKEMFRRGRDVKDREAEERRDKARDRYSKLVEALAPSSPDVAATLLERWFEATAETRAGMPAAALYADQWPARFTALFRIVAEWSSYPAIASRLTGFATSKAPEHLRDAVLAHAAALEPESSAEADAAWAALEPQLSDKGPAEHWFLLTLLRAGLPEHALEMARRSPRATEILPCLRRAWLYEHPDSARLAIRPEDVAGDEISEFLLHDLPGRVAFLRERTLSGHNPLPETMWRPPSPADLVRDDGAGAAVGAWYTKDEAKENQFATFLRIHGYGRHLYEHLDPVLLETLVAWDEAYPDEAGRVIRGMWESMRAEIKNNIRLDLIRNDILDRCEAVLGAHPATAKEFLAWVHRELVSQPVQERVGDTVYTFRLNAQAPFLYGLFAARKVAGISPKRCDAILEHVIATYGADDDLLAPAAQLYAADKGLAALEPPVPLKQPAQLTAWQLGVVETSLPDLLAALERDGEAAPGKVVAEEPEAPAEVMSIDEGAIVAHGSAVRCSACGKSVRRLESPFAEGQVVTFGMDPSALDQWLANVCVDCRRVFCDECLELGGPTPCPTCGEPTLPAQRMNLQRIGLSPAG